MYIMYKMTNTIQKYLIMFFLFGINLLLSNTFALYQNEWYVYLFILMLASLINTFSVLFIAGQKVISNDKDLPRIEPKNYLYVVPCYNESKQELVQSLNSITLQRCVKNDKRTILIICDGIIRGKGNSNTTDMILKEILNINELAEYYDYKTWDNNRNIINLYTGIYKYLTESIDFILLIKNKNYGKRDSLVLVRKLCYYYNTNVNNATECLFKYMFNLFKTIYDTKIDYIIGIDADTIFDYNCSYELIQSMEKDKDIHGCVGYVDIQPNNNSMYSPFVLYQYGEYMFSQCLRRYAQSKITQKVNCLSGCNQILRVSMETCGDSILNVLNYLPAATENIFNHIRSYASEDRNHICHVLSMYPYVKSIQNLKAIAYTNVPTNVNVFLSQRRRWNLGTITNDMLLVYLPGINIFERILAFVNILTFSISPFIFIATAFFIKNIIVNPTLLMLYLSIIILIPIVYSFMIPVFIRPLSFRDSIYYYVSYITFIVLSSFVKLTTFGYSILNMDTMSWGKTRSVEPTHNIIEIEDSSDKSTNESTNDSIHKLNVTDEYIDIDEFIDINEFTDINKNIDYIHKPPSEINNIENDSINDNIKLTII